MYQARPLASGRRREVPVWISGIATPMPHQCNPLPPTCTSHSAQCSMHQYTCSLSLAMCVCRCMCVCKHQARQNISSKTQEGQRAEHVSVLFFGHFLLSVKNRGRECACAQNQRQTRHLSERIEACGRAHERGTCGTAQTR